MIISDGFKWLATSHESVAQQWHISWHEWVTLWAKICPPVRPSLVLLGLGIDDTCQRTFACRNSLTSSFCATGWHLTPGVLVSNNSHVYCLDAHGSACSLPQWESFHIGNNKQPVWKQWNYFLNMNLRDSFSYVFLLFCNPMTQICWRLLVLTSCCLPSKYFIHPVYAGCLQLCSTYLRYLRSVQQTLSIKDLISLINQFIQHTQFTHSVPQYHTVRPCQNDH